MSSTENAQLEPWFATSSRARPLKTYSQKASRRHGSLPQLKPKAPPKTLRRNQRTESPDPISGGTTSGVKARRDPPNGLQRSHNLETGSRGAGHGRPLIPEIRITPHSGEDDEDDSDVETSGMNDDTPSHTDSSQDESSSDETEQISSWETPDELNSPQQAATIPTNKRPAPNNPKSTNGIRRRPFVIFNNSPKKIIGYKKLTHKPDVHTTTNYNPGDGFSDGEARPYHMFQLTKKRKLHFAASGVGELDLTQTPPGASTNPAAAANKPKEPRIIRKRMKRVRDNSFLPPTPKKARVERRKERGQGQGQESEMGKEMEKTGGEGAGTVAPGLSAPYGQVESSLALGESQGLEGEPYNQVQSSLILVESQGLEGERVAPRPQGTGGNDETRGGSLPAVNDPINGPEVCVKFSDLPIVTDTKHSSSQDGVIVSNTPPRRSMSLELLPMPEGLVNAGRSFRRVKTQ